MNNVSRTQNTIVNIFAGYASQFINFILVFVTRTIFIRKLGTEYLGINGLYSSILTVLSLAELGVGNVLMFSLYKPIREDNKKEICRLMFFYKKIYKKIAVAVFLIGVSLIPFLDIIVENDLDYINLVIYYLIFLMNSVVSYLAVYKSILINADQRNHITTSFKTGFIILQYLLQIIALFFENYILYLLCILISTVLYNFTISQVADKMYPFLKNKTNDNYLIDTSAVLENVKSVFIYKIGVVLMNNTDNILLSYLFGTNSVGLYSNYLIILNTIHNLISICIRGMTASLGNLNAEKNLKKSYDFFKMLTLLFHSITAYCSVCLLLCFNPFIEIWLGNEYVLENIIVFSIVFSFYIQNIINPVWMYRETYGLFNKIKYLMIAAATLNLMLSIVLAQFMGIAGIIIATGLSRILTTVWYEPKVLFKNVFSQPVAVYYYQQLKYFATTIIIYLICYRISYLFPNSIIELIIKCVIYFIITAFIFFITNIRCTELKLLLEYIKSAIIKLIIRNK